MVIYTDQNIILSLRADPDFPPSVEKPDSVWKAVLRMRTVVFLTSAPCGLQLFSRRVCHHEPHIHPAAHRYQPHTVWLQLAYTACTTIREETEAISEPAGQNGRVQRQNVLSNGSTKSVPSRPVANPSTENSHSEQREQEAEELSFISPPPLASPLRWL